jgi:hypothetical protein
MKVDRNTMRLALPPILAIGLVALLTTPLSASSAAPLDARQASLVTGSSIQSSVQTSNTTASANIRVGVAPVAFAESVTIIDGHLHAPVLLADENVTAFASIDGATTGAGCTAKLTAGVPAWLDCTIDVAPGGDPRVVVALSDGRTASKHIAAG